ncbi:hypothetical protein PJ985_00075 [Streptomyces sp. ACA25]|uniref:hypothetical protein n=1 Tax=Streptomyces sp. ACA25 TaxID=3022596 RepID=UPI002307BEDD|nr:hypothetical protein [Streptomyces sp. ACA25]MDB1085985.1 hypothetical protein [Streptomyces sp. ACA25]
MTSVLTPPGTEDLVATVRDTARDQGLVAALVLLHRTAGEAVLPAGDGGYVLLPPETAAACGHFTTGSGPRPRGPEAPEQELGSVRADRPGDRLVALRVEGAGHPGDRWRAGVLAARLGAADRLLRQATDRLRDRRVQGSSTLKLSLVRSLVAEAALGIAEARALTADTPGSAELHRAHRALDASGRTCLHLFGASGYLTDGPGSAIRASELLGDVYAAPARPTPPDTTAPDTTPPDATAPDTDRPDTDQEPT